MYVSVYGFSETSYTINISEEPTDPTDPQWQAPCVDFVDMNPETNGSKYVF